MTTNYFHDCTACRIEALEVACPICDSPPGQHCHDIGGVLLIDHPHHYRVVVAAEEAKR